MKKDDLRQILMNVFEEVSKYYCFSAIRDLKASEHDQTFTSEKRGKKHEQNK